jgi:hypothetical protein
MLFGFERDDIDDRNNQNNAIYNYFKLSHSPSFLPFQNQFTLNGFAVFHPNQAIFNLICTGHLSKESLFEKSRHIHEYVRGFTGWNQIPAFAVHSDVCLAAAYSATVTQNPPTQ